MAHAEPLCEIVSNHVSGPPIRRGVRQRNIRGHGLPYYLGVDGPHGVGRDHGGKPFAPNASSTILSTAPLQCQAFWYVRLTLLS